MGELFRRTIPSRALNWTGERLVSAMHGTIEDEHLHRYFVARELCRGKNILDVASGEGYGTALLAQTALSAIGVEIDPESVDHANRSYVSPKLKYLIGDARNLPIESNSIDVVVSFETLEHLCEQDRFLAEVARVLKPEGLLFVSTPDPEVYSGTGVPPNPYHVRELTLSEFREALSQFFAHSAMYRQRAAAGSTIWPDGSRCNVPAWIFDQRSSDTFEVHRSLPRAPYLLGLASNAPLPCLSGSLFLHNQDPIEFETAAELQRIRGTEASLSQAQAEIERLRAVEEAYKKQEVIVNDTLHKADQMQRDAIRIREECSQLQTENMRLTAVEAAYREQEAVVRERLANADRLQREKMKMDAELSAAATRTRELELELTHLRAMESTREREQSLTETKLNAAEETTTRLRGEIAQLSGVIDRHRDELNNARQESHNATLLARQQALVSQRLQQEIQRLQREGQNPRQETQRLQDELTATTDKVRESELKLDEAQRQLEAFSVELRECRASAARSEQMVRELSGLIVPVWFRKLLPPGVRPIARKIKRALAG